jgi:hypothetical protein
MGPQNTSSATKYIMTNKATGLTQEMYAHTFGEGYVDFAPASEAGTDAWTTTPTLTRFINEHSDGMLTNEEYDIHVDLGEVLTADAPAESVVVTDEVAA